MIYNGYLKGDDATMVHRTVVDGDLKMAVVLEEQDRMLVLILMENGELCMSFTSIIEAGLQPMKLIGHVTQDPLEDKLVFIGDDPGMDFMFEDGPIEVVDDTRHLKSVD